MRIVRLNLRSGLEAHYSRLRTCYFRLSSLLLEIIFDVRRNWIDNLHPCPSSAWIILFPSFPNRKESRHDSRIDCNQSNPYRSGIERLQPQFLEAWSIRIAIDWDQSDPPQSNWEPWNLYIRSQLQPWCLIVDFVLPSMHLLSLNSVEVFH